MRDAMPADQRSVGARRAGGGVGGKGASSRHRRATSFKQPRRLTRLGGLPFGKDGEGRSLEHEERRTTPMETVTGGPSCDGNPPTSDSWEDSART